MATARVGVRADPIRAPDGPHPVTPANAGVQQRTSLRPRPDWIPACAGMTGWGVQAGLVRRSDQRRRRVIRRWRSHDRIFGRIDVCRPRDGSRRITRFALGPVNTTDARCVACANASSKAQTGAGSRTRRASVRASRATRIGAFTQATRREWPYRRAWRRCPPCPDVQSGRRRPSCPARRYGHSHWHP